MSNTTIPAPSNATITGFSYDRVNRTATFSASVDNGRGNIYISASVTDPDPKDKDPAKTALLAGLKAAVADVTKALEDLA